MINSQLPVCISVLQCGGQLELLDLSHCGLEGGDLPSLVALLDNCGRLRELRLAGGGIGKEGVAQLCKYVPGQWG